MCEHEKGADDAAWHYYTLYFFTDCYSSVSFMLHLAAVSGWEVCTSFTVSAVAIAAVFTTDVIAGDSSTTYCVNAVLKMPVKKRRKGKNLTVSDSLQKLVSQPCWCWKTGVSPETVFEQHKVELVILKLWDKRWNLFITELGKTALNLNVGVWMCVWMCVLRLPHTKICYFLIDKLGNMWANTCHFVLDFPETKESQTFPVKDPCFTSQTCHCSCGSLQFLLALMFFQYISALLPVRSL